MTRRFRIAIITTDARHWLGQLKEPTPNFGAAIRALLQGFETLDNVELHVISASPTRFDSPQMLGAFTYFHHLYIPRLLWGRTLFLGCVIGIRRLLRRIRPDFVHGQGTERECAIAAALCGYPNVVTIHGNVKELHRLGMFGTGFYGPMASFVESWALRRTSGVLCNSLYTRRLVAPRACQTWLVPNAIRAEFLQSTAGVSQQGIPAFVVVGLICPRKRQVELLKMAGEIVSSGKRMRMVFVGELDESSDYGAAFATELRKAIAEDYAEFVGFLEVQYLIKLLDSSQAFLHFPQEEAFGLVVAEGLARGLKFFGARLGGIVDIASGIDGAELHDDLDSLRVSIIRWLDSGAPAPALAAEEIARRYHPAVIAKEHLRIYREVLGR